MRTDLEVVAEKIEEELNRLNKIIESQIYSKEKLYNLSGEINAYHRVLNWITHEITDAEEYADIDWLIEAKPKGKKSPLFVGAANCVKNAGMKNVGEIAHTTEFSFRMTRNLGTKKFDFIKEILNDCGLTFGMSFDEIKESYHLPEYTRRVQ